MKTIRAPLILLAVLYLCFLGYMVHSAGQLPDRVATHFDGGGRPNGWMSRSGHLTFTGVLGLGLPMGVVGICFLLRRLPNNLINIPRRDYWLAPERRAETLSFLFRSSLWFASILVAFLIGIQVLLVSANRHHPAFLDSSALLGLIGFLVGGIGLWTLVIFRRFWSGPSKPEDSKGDPAGARVG